MVDLYWCIIIFWHSYWCCKATETWTKNNLSIKIINENMYILKLICLKIKTSISMCILMLCIYIMWYIYNIYLYIYTSKVFRQRKELIWNLNFHAYTAGIFSQMNKTLNLQYHGIFCIIWRHIKVFTKCFDGKLVCPVIWWAT